MRGPIPTDARPSRGAIWKMARTKVKTMPEQWWRFDCGCKNRTQWLRQAVCPECGAHGQYVGWQLTLEEKMAAFTRVTSLPATGRARMTPEGKAVQDRRVLCKLCMGKGLIEDPLDRDTWAFCPQCQGNRCALDGEFFKEEVKGALDEPLPGVGDEETGWSPERGSDSDWGGGSS